MSPELFTSKKSGLFFAAIATRLDIAFAVFRPLRSNQQLGQKHHKVVDQVFDYLL